MSTSATEIRYATVNPFTGETVKEFDFLDSAEVPALVERAASAYRDWRATPVADRAAVVGKAAELMLERIDDLASLITLEMGKRAQEAQGEVKLAASILAYYAEKGPGFLEPKPLEVAKGEALVAYDPVGVILAIEPWNYPLYQVARVAGPNLVLGNTLVLKHSEVCPQSALALEQLFRDAGAPEGVFTNAFLHRDDVETVIADPAVQGVTLTGSEGAGAAVAALAGKHLKKCVLELGGSDPFIVLDDHNLDFTVGMATAGRLSNTGQACIAAKRIMVVDEVYDDFVAGLAKSFEGLEPGDPSDPATALAPLSSERAAQGLLEQLQDALDKGAKAVVGGGRPDRTGAFVEPTILTDVTPEMRAFHEELFGPVAVVYRVKDADEAVELANSSPYGLGGSVFAGDADRAREVADRLESGMVFVNALTSSQADLPFGGVKRSGFGRELSELGISEFANRKLVRTMPPRPPKPKG
jgi:succinate-semialdehyde dehydrogenase/glutarate-semialdehyde dehydrogenase